MPQVGTRVFERLPAQTVAPLTAKAFALAALCTLAALGVRLAIGFAEPSAPPFATFLFATMVSAIMAGLAAGIASAGLSLALAWLFLEQHVPSAFTWPALGQYILVSALIIWVSYEYRRMLRRSRNREIAAEREMRLIEAENDVMALIASDQPLPVTLKRLLMTIEQYCDHQVHASILLLSSDGEHLCHWAAPSLPEEYVQAIDGQKIGPQAGSCGTAAFRGEAVYVDDIEADPLWKDYRHLALPHGLRACWSIPIMSRAKTVLGTFAVYATRPRSPQGQEIEIVTLLVKFAALAIEREREKDQRELLVQELAHRMKNALAVVGSIASSSLRGYVEEGKYNDFEQRLGALAQVQSLLAQSSWTGISVDRLIRDIATAPFADDQGRFHLDGPAINLPAQLTLPFALSVHELCTNAVKYGALTSDAGRIDIEWGYRPPDKPDQFYLKWVERNGPGVVEPERQGFGTRMIKTAFAKSVGGDARWHYHAEGVECEIVLPLAALAGDPAHETIAPTHR